MRCLHGCKEFLSSLRHIALIIYCFESFEAILFRSSLRKIRSSFCHTTFEALALQMREILSIKFCRNASLSELRVNDKPDEMRPLALRHLGKTSLDAVQASSHSVHIL